MEAEETKKQIKNIGWTLGNDCPCKCKTLLFNEC